MYSRMATIDSTVAQMPLRVSSSPTMGPTISLPTMLKLPRLDCFKALVICSRERLNDPSDSLPTSGTRTMILCSPGAPYSCTDVSTPGNACCMAPRT